MTRQLLALIVSTLTLVPYAVKAQEPTPKETAQPQSNQVYVKIIMPTDPADRDKDRRVVESWIAEDLKKRGQAKFTAVTGWVPLDLSPFEATDVWDGIQRGVKARYCPAHADIPDRGDGRIKVNILGWGPASATVTVSLTDEPGSRAIAAVEEHKTEQGMPYVAVLIGPPADKSDEQAKGLQPNTSRTGIALRFEAWEFQETDGHLWLKFRKVTEKDNPLHRFLLPLSVQLAGVKTKFVPLVYFKGSDNERKKQQEVNDAIAAFIAEQLKGKTVWIEHARPAIFAGPSQVMGIVWFDRDRKRSLQQLLVEQGLAVRFDNP